MNNLLRALHSQPIFFEVFRMAPVQYASQLANAVVNVEGTEGRETVHIKGVVLNSARYESMQLLAASPATRGVSYSGSALPFPCSQIAFDGSPNVADVSENGVFDVVFEYPNSYYTHDAFTKVVSSVFLMLKERNPNVPAVFVRFELPDRNILRTLTHRPERRVLGPEFYVMKEEIMGIASQETLLRRIGGVKENYGLS